MARRRYTPTPGRGTGIADFSPEDLITALQSGYHDVLGTGAPGIMGDLPQQAPPLWPESVPGQAQDGGLPLELAQALAGLPAYQPGRFESGGQKFAGGLLHGLASGFAGPILEQDKRRAALQDQLRQEAAARNAANLQETQRLREGRQQHEYRLQEAAAAAAGKKPESEPVESVVGPGGKPVYVPRSQAAGKEPYYKPSAAQPEFNPADYVDTSELGINYVNLSAIPDRSQQRVASSYARANKIPIANKDGQDALDLVKKARANLDLIESSASSFLPSGTGINALNPQRVWNPVSGALGMNPAISSFPSFRTAAITSIQGIAALGKGLRINQAEIKTALDNDIPTATDTQEIAAGKLTNVRGMLDNVERAVLGQPRVGPTRRFGQPSGQTVERGPDGKLRLAR